MKALLGIGYVLVLLATGTGAVACWFGYTAFQSWADETERSGSVAEAAVTVGLALLAVAVLVGGMWFSHVVARLIWNADVRRDEEKRVGLRDQSVSSPRTSSSPPSPEGGER